MNNESKVYIVLITIGYTLRERCPYSELFWSAFSRIRTEYGDILHISPHSVRMRENADQNNFEHGHFSRSDNITESHIRKIIIEQKESNFLFRTIALCLLP